MVEAIHGDEAGLVNWKRILMDSVEREPKIVEPGKFLKIASKFFHSCVSSGGKTGLRDRTMRLRERLFGAPVFLFHEPPRFAAKGVPSFHREIHPINLLYYYPSTGFSNYPLTYHLIA
jgi:hypothetical protein